MQKEIQGISELMFLQAMANFEPLESNNVTVIITSICQHTEYCPWQPAFTFTSSTIETQQQSAKSIQI